MRRILICGDRNWVNGPFIFHTLSKIQQEQGVEVVIEGEANGADKLGATAARMLNVPVLKFPANWQKHGKSAGPIRNRKQLKEGAPDLVLAFHNDIANSKGTKDMVRISLQAKIETHVYTEQGEVQVVLKG
jgi:hypothetical protein